MSGTSEVRLPGWDQISLIGNTDQGSVANLESLTTVENHDVDTRESTEPAGLVSVFASQLSSVEILKGRGSWRPADQSLLADLPGPPFTRTILLGQAGTRGVVEGWDARAHI